MGVDWAMMGPSAKRMRKLHAFHTLSASFAEHNFDLDAEEWCLNMAQKILGLTLRQEALGLHRLVLIQGHQRMLRDIAAEYLERFGSGKPSAPVAAEGQNPSCSGAGSRVARQVESSRTKPVLNEIVLDSWE